MNFEIQPGTTRLRRLFVDRQGLALLEFAFALPVVLALLLYGLETANLGLSMLRVHQIAATAADNAARVRDSITETDINEVLLGGKIVGDRMAFADQGRLVLSSVAPNDQTGTNAGQKIIWQRCTGALATADSAPKYGVQGKGATDSSLPAMGATGKTLAASPGSVMIFAEVTYKYKPVVSSTLLGTPVLRSEAAYTVRERPTETIGAGSSGTPSSVCTRHDL